MVSDFNNLPDDGDLQADICIAGAGAAGITLARQLLAGGHSVCLVESGGTDFEAPTQALYEGDNTGMRYYDLAQSRLRFFGGTTNIWGGRCAPLDPIDFESRPWVPLSGWPIAASDLQHWYRVAHDTLGLGAYDYDADKWLYQLLDTCATSGGSAARGPLRAGLWRFDPQHDRFSWRRNKDVLESPRCQVITHANVVNVDVNEAAERALAMRLRSLSGRTGRVIARYFVLACGGIENARLLLLSDGREPGGIGNRFDQVGRCFMEHPHGRIGRIHTPHAFALWQGLRKRFPPSGPALAPALLLSAQEQAERGLLNSAVTLKLQRDPSRGLDTGRRLYQYLRHELNPTGPARRAHHIYRAARDWLTRNARDQLIRVGTSLGKLQLHLIIRAEQAPDPGSRVTLALERDAIGCRKVQLHWRLNRQDKDTATGMAETIDRELRRLGLGCVEQPQWLRDGELDWPVDPTVSNHPIGGYHHMGTTRMSSDPCQGVVDLNCAVHGYDNLYIAGSSVFSTSGWANPTLTLLALTHRLAHHLDQRLSADI